MLKSPRGLASRFRILAYRMLGLQAGTGNRFEGGGRCRRLRQIQIGDFNAFTQGCWLWPEDTDHDGMRIRIGNGNYFNRNVMIDACGCVTIGDENMFGPDVYITDSNHTWGPGKSPGKEPMTKGTVRIGNRCWIGAKAVILSGVELGDGCVVGAGAVVTRSVPAGEVVAGIPARALKPKGRLKPQWTQINRALRHDFGRHREAESIWLEAIEVSRSVSVFICVHLWLKLLSLR
jgi:acetyltransferase-like isoleucine patch superfamily enzyme